MLKTVGILSNYFWILICLLFLDIFYFSICIMWLTMPPARKRRTGMPNLWTMWWTIWGTISRTIQSTIQARLRARLIIKPEMITNGGLKNLICQAWDDHHWWMNKLDMIRVATCNYDHKLCWKNNLHMTQLGICGPHIITMHICTRVNQQAKQQNEHTTTHTNDDTYFWSNQNELDYDMRFEQ